MLDEPKQNKRAGLPAPLSPTAELAVTEEACQQLVNCYSLPKVKYLRDRAEAYRHYARSAKKGLELVNKAAEMKIRAERRAGQLLAEMQLHGGDRVSASHDAHSTLEVLGISQNQAARWQKEAVVPEDKLQSLH